MGGGGSTGSATTTIIDHGFGGSSLKRAIEKILDRPCEEDDVGFESFVLIPGDSTRASPTFAKGRQDGEFLREKNR